MRDSGRAPSLERIRRLVHGELSGSEAERVWQGLRAHPEAQRVFDRLVRAEQALEVGRPGIGSFAADRVRRRVFASIPEPVAVRWWRRLAGPSATLAVAASLAFAVWLPPDRPQVGFQARSGTVGTAISHRFVLQLLRVRIGVDGGLQVAPAQQLRSGDRVRFAVVAPQGEWRVSIVVVHDDGRREVLASRATLSAWTPRARRLDVALTVPASWQGHARFVGLFEPERSSVDLSTVSLRVRDEDGLAVRSVTTVVERPDR